MIKPLTPENVEHALDSAYTIEPVGGFCGAPQRFLVWENRDQLIIEEELEPQARTLVCITVDREGAEEVVRRFRKLVKVQTRTAFCDCARSTNAAKWQEEQRRLKREGQHCE